MERKKKYFTLNSEKATNVGRLYLSPKIHKRLSNLPGHPVISSSGTLTKSVSEFLDHHLQPVIKEEKHRTENKGEI